MTSAQILAIPPGPELDLAVHSYVMAGTGEPPAYSTNEAEGIKLLDRLGLYVGRVSAQHPRFNAAKPFVAGVLAHDQASGGDTSRLRVTAASRPVALCKAALILTLEPAKLDRKVAIQTSAETAKALAARVGTPGARGAAAGAAAANEAKTKRDEAAQRRQASADRKAAKLAKKLGASAPVAPQPVRQPVRGGPAQPGVPAGYRRPLQEMPARPKEFVEPQKIHTGGGERGGAAPS